MTDPILIDTCDAVTVLTIDRPDTRNAISDDDVVESMEHAIQRVGADRAIRVLVITGGGRAFSSGGNIKHMRDSRGMFGGSPADIRDGYRQGIQRIPRSLYHCEVPTIAAVNGPAIGAGLDLALMCDIRIASTAAVFAESFVKLGLVPGDGGAWLLPRAVGMQRACEMAFTGDPIDATTALNWGLVSRITSPATLLDTALGVARRIAMNPTQAVRMTKRLMREAQHQSLESQLELAASLQAIAHHTRDHRDAVNPSMEAPHGSNSR